MRLVVSSWFVVFGVEEICSALSYHPWNFVSPGKNK